MSQPPAYARSYSFTDHTANHPNDPQPGVSLDNEFDDVALTANAIRANLALIQRDDGALANRAVGPDQLSLELTLGLRSISDWAALTAYVANDATWSSAKLYRCKTSHTSSASFATDLAASKWELVLDIAPYAMEALQTGAVTVNVDTAFLQTQIDTKAGLADANQFTAAQTIKVGGATTAAPYLNLKPTDYGAAKPALVGRKLATAKAWELAVDDGAGGSGTLNIAASDGVTLNGSAPWTAANFTPADKADQTALDALTPKLIRNRRLALAL